jgi:glycosyltransferase involved in cell wall biosynthesis
MIDRARATPDPARRERDPDAARDRPRIALAHDWLCGLRGGEQVLERIASVVRTEFDSRALYTMFDDGGSIGPATDDARHVASWLNALPGALRRWLLPLYPSAVAQLSSHLSRDHAKDPIDLLISSSSAAIKAMRAPDGVPHLCYCHAPARYIWSRAAEYSRGLSGLGLSVLAPAYKRWDRTTAPRVTRFIANSTYIRSEIARCYQRDADVVHPPVRTDRFTPDPSVPREDNLLVVSALEPYKRVDLAIETAKAKSLPLTIVGGGSDEARLRAMSGPTVTFAGRVDDETLLRHYRSARALLFPQIEDFGIVAVEAQACGTPVVAFRAGGALDIVVDGVTGVLFDHPTPESLADAIERVEQNPRACRQNAERFSERRFDERIRAIILEMLDASSA